MNEKNDLDLVCHVCQKSFSCVSTKNRHLRSVHLEDVKRKTKNTVHIQCPLCTEEEKKSFGSHDLLITHLETDHSINIKTSFHNFRTMEEFETWRALNSKNVGYVVHSTSESKSSSTKSIYYNCNRSNFRGFVSKCSQRRMKTGGSIRISGLCPSRICLKICGSEISVKFIETHVGHGDQLRSKQLKESQQQKNSIEENGGSRSTNVSSDQSRKREDTYARACKLLKLLNEDDFYRITSNIEKAYSEQTKNASDSKKRKIG